MSEPVVRISDQTWTRLQEWAVPLVDSVDDALIRVLDAAGSPKTSRNPRRQVGQIKAKRAQSKDATVPCGVATGPTTYGHRISVRRMWIEFHLSSYVGVITG